MWTTYWFEIVGEDSEICGEEFFTELEDATKEQHIAYAHKIFPNEKIVCWGKVTQMEAEMMGLDTYQKGGINMKSYYKSTEQCEQIRECWKEYRIQEYLENDTNRNFINGYLYSDGDTLEESLSIALKNKKEYDKEIEKLKKEISDANFRLAELMKDAKINDIIIENLTPVPIENTFMWKGWKNRSPYFMEHWFVNE